MAKPLSKMTPIEKQTWWTIWEHSSSYLSNLVLTSRRLKRFIQKSSKIKGGNNKLTCSSTTAWTAASGTMGLPTIVWLLEPNKRTLFKITWIENEQIHKTYEILLKGIRIARNIN